MLHLDLFNFEEPAAAVSKYVITSPRSLEACSRYGIKPVELLHKPLSYFEDENSSYGTGADVNAVYHEYERQRLRKLRLCREERERLINEEEWSFLLSDGHVASTPTPKAVKASTSDYQSASAGKHRLVGQNHVTRAMQYGTQPVARSTRGSHHNAKYSKSDRDDDMLLHPSHTPNNGVDQDQHRDVYGKTWHCDNDDGTVDRSASAVGLASSSSGNHTAEREQLRQLHEKLRKSNNGRATKAHCHKESSALHRTTRQPQQQHSRNSRNERLMAARADVQAKFDRWKAEFDSHVNHRNAEMLSKKIAEEERKLCQEAKRKEQELRIGLARRAGHLETSSRCKEAQKLKDYLQLQRQLDVQLRNDEEREKHALQMEALQAENRRREIEMRREMEERQAAAARNARKATADRQRETTENRLRDDDRRALQQEQLAAMETDTRRWQEDLVRYQRQALDRANRVAEINIRERAARAFEQRTQKETEHALNKSKVADEDSLKREGIIMNIEMKNKRSEIVAADKINYVKTCRDVALASSTMRESLRDHPTKSSFDKMALEADLLARLDRGAYIR